MHNRSRMLALTWMHRRRYGVGLEGETLARPVSSSSEELCKKCHTDDPQELKSWSMVFAFLALTSGPSLTYLCFSLSVEFFVEVGTGVRWTSLLAASCL